MLYSLPWYSCNKCLSLFLYRQDGIIVNAGRCPAGAGHDYTGEIYVLAIGPSSFPPAFQYGGELCGKCGGLFWKTTHTGWCAAGGGHQVTGSETYYVLAGIQPPPIRSAWQLCIRCRLLFAYGPTEISTSGWCPAGGGHDPGAGNPVYSIQANDHIVYV